MTIFAINSSPRSRGPRKTDLMLSELVDGMRDTGARVEVINLRENKHKKLHWLLHLLDQNPRQVSSQRRYDP